MMRENGEIMIELKKMAAITTDGDAARAIQRCYIHALEWALGKDSRPPHLLFSASMALNSILLQAQKEAQNENHE